MQTNHLSELEFFWDTRCKSDHNPCREEKWLWCVCMTSRENDYVWPMGLLKSIVQEDRNSQAKWVIAI